MQIKEFELFIDALCSLPAISKKTASKIAYFLLQKDESYIKEFIKRIIDFKTKIKSCILCNNLTVENLKCDICLQDSRDKSKLCVVSNVEDLSKIEQSNSFFGVYYVLNFELSIKNINSNTKIDLSKLENIINFFNINQILFATNMTSNGELTSNYIKNFLIKKNYEIDFYRLALGIPFNSLIDYIDWESLKHSIKNKKKF